MLLQKEVNHILHLASNVLHLTSHLSHLILFFPRLRFLSKSACHKEGDLERVFTRDRDPEGATAADKRQDRVWGMSDVICVLSGDETYQLYLYLFLCIYINIKVCLSITHSS
jgi:hypothetical protein